MVTFRIIRIYEIPADNQMQATNRMMEAIVLHAERNYHVMDYVETPADPEGEGWPVDLTPPKGWLSSMLDDLATQIIGKAGWKKPELYVGKSMHELEQEKKKR